MQGSLPAMINSVSCSNTPSLITSRVACTLNIWRVGSLSFSLSLYICVCFSQTKKINKNTFSSCCIVGYSSDDHCKLNIELNLPLNHFKSLYHSNSWWPTSFQQLMTGMQLTATIAALLVKPDMQNHQGMAHLHHKAMAGQPTPPNVPRPGFNKALLKET